MKGAVLIQNLQRRWQREQQLTLLAVGWGVGLLLAVITKLVWGWQDFRLLIPVFFCLVPAILWAQRKKTGTEEVTARLDQSFPSLEDSSSLLLAASQPTSLLQHLQIEKVEQAMAGIQPPQPYSKNLLITCCAAGLAACLLAAVPAKQTALQQAADSQVSTTSTTKPPIPLQMAAATIRIQPPAYTRLPTIEQKQFAVQTVQGAELQWTLQTNKPVQKMQLLFNDSTVLPLRAVDSTHTRWAASKKIDKSGFYRLDTDALPSDFYTIDVKPDLPPVVNISSPEGQTSIEAGMPFRVMIQSQLRDDYGLASAQLVATIASGSGEAVTFRNERIDISSLVRGKEYIQWNRVLDLNQWQLKGGDELYFYLEATDERKQTARSDISIVHLPDTTELLSMDGMLTAMDIKPEFFRSQRQIIIETEQLIRDKKTLSTEAYNAKSNELGGEQKLLRLRYGKFLGEEDETNIGGHHDHEENEAHNDAADFGNAAKVLSEVSHQHDVAEDATFFDAETKKQLKATLTEMWNAELKLRIYQPEQALPYEYKALRLLKDLQQQSRVFVGKTGVKTTPLDPAKRGTGDQDKIMAPRFSFKQNKVTTPEQDIARALVNLQDIAHGGRGDLGDLQKAAALLSTAAGKKPASLLPKYKAMLRVMDAVGRKARVNKEDIRQTANGLGSLLDPAPGLPAPVLSAPTTPAAKEYLQQLTGLSN